MTLPKFLQPLASFFMYTPPNTSPDSQQPIDEAYDKDLLVNIDHQVVSVGEKLQELDQSTSSLEVQTSDIKHQFESIEHLPENIADINSYNKTQDAQIERIKSSEFDDANTIKNILENLETVKADITQLRADINDLKIPLRQSSGSASLASGHTELQVSNQMVDPTSKIFLSLTTPANVQLSVIAKTPNHSFTVRASNASESDLSFDYWIVNEPAVFHPQPS